MPDLIEKINRALAVAEARRQPAQEPREITYYAGWWKDPYHPMYNRAYAEDCLQRILGPMRPDSTWTESPWDPQASKRVGLRPDMPPPDGCAPPDEYTPGGPAPQWTETEVTVALAGDPATPNGPKGFNTSPLMSVARQVAAGKRKGESLYELYTLGLARLAELLKPGMDQARSPFRVYAMQDIRLAMQNGFGSTKELNAAKTAIKTMVTSRDPAAILQIIDKIQDPYRDVEPEAPATKFDKDPRNAYSRYSGIIYKFGAELLYAMQEGDVEYETELREELQKQLDNLEASTEMTLGIKTGLFQAMSQQRSTEKAYETGYRWLVNAKNADDARMILNPKSSKFRNKKAPYDEGKEQHTAYIMQKAQQLLDAFNDGDTETVQAIKNEVLSKAPSVKKRGIQSIDAPIGDDGFSAAETIAAQPEESALFSTDIINEVLKMGLEGKIVQFGNDPALYNLNDPNDSKNFEDAVLPMVRDMHQKIVSVGLKNMPSPKDVKLSVRKISKPFTAMEFRSIIRILGPMASNYPGKGNMRANLDVPRDTEGWWSPGEDPEIELIPETDEKWESIWSRNGYPAMQSLQINKEMTEEAFELIQLDIQSAYVAKILKGEKLSKDGVINRQSMNEIVLSAYFKMLVILALFNEELRGDDLNESVLDRTDAQLLFEGAFKIAKMLAHTYNSAMVEQEVFVPEFDLSQLYRANKLRKTAR